MEERVTAKAERGRGLASPALGIFLQFLALSWTVIFLDRGRSLPLAPDAGHFLIGEVVTLLVIGILVRLARDRRPIDDRSGLPIRQPAGETLGLLCYLVFILVLGRFLGVAPHIAGAGMSSGAAVAWETQTAGSVLRWAVFNFVTGVAIPLFYFLARRRYSAGTLLLGFPRGKKWVFFCVIVGLFGVMGADPRSTFNQPVAGHLLTILLFSLGTFLPIMILFESLLAPRLAILSKSAAVGAVLSGVAYGLYHPFEFYLDWSSGAAILVSLAWLVQIMFFGVVKGISTLWTGSAWIHIFTTHTIHLSEVPEVVRVFRLKS